MWKKQYDHYIQSQRMGAFYIPVVAMPSLKSAMFTSSWSGMDHSRRWFEVDASNLAAKHFDEKYGSKAKGYTLNNPNYFSRKAFSTIGLESPYVNPRVQNYNWGNWHYTNASKTVIWDFLF